MSIYVEIRIRADVDALWTHTQTPQLHERWDLRFTSIDYLPKLAADGPQRFLYRTRIGFGLEIAGEGESVGEHHGADGTRTSSLTFGSSDRRSLIVEGSGYWKYIPEPEGIRFLTWYDYRTRFGVLGSLVDRMMFRPVLGWATAWSFDRLRLWLERGVDPAAALRRALIHGVSRLSLGFVFAYHGLVPKLIARHGDELAMMRDAGVSAGFADAAVVGAGAAEVLFAGLLLLFWRRSWPAIVCVVAMIAATIEVSVNSSSYLVGAFNPISLNLAMAALAVIDLLSVHDLPSASRCLRKPPGGAP